MSGLSVSRCQKYHHGDAQLSHPQEREVLVRADGQLFLHDWILRPVCLHPGESDTAGHRRGQGSLLVIYHWNLKHGRACHDRADRAMPTPGLCARHHNRSHHQWRGHHLVAPDDGLRCDGGSVCCLWHLCW
ncbi:hypothetical protein EGW08_009436 [Elysia chlorotica]|uniref:Uncharacterized protein n=1 Tax=Elysia chlorotica TaxID=188477 RepID=A0A433TMS5_ELYCH|nr:hypothetical protein EGW08_009436 [Elysia chlorotica]